jgi:predicted dehydrogenase
MFPEAKKIPVFNDYKELLKLESVQWVMIGSKNYQHRQETRISL